MAPLALQGRIKDHPEDFLVEEIPLYAPSGTGEHLYLGLRKRDLTHDRLVERLARGFDVRRSAIGWAGRKDRRAVTTQAVSIHLPGVEREIPDLGSDIDVLWSSRHGNKLRPGHLRGNRFTIRVRKLDAARMSHARSRLASLSDEGLPNAFGPQRFGASRNSHLLGAAVLRGDDQALLSALLGSGGGAGDPATEEARAAFDRGDLDAAEAAWPASLRTEFQVLSALRHGKPPRAALRAVRTPLRRFWVNALQSAIFNHVLEQRRADGTWSVLLPGDLALDMRGAKTFVVDEDTLENADVIGRVECGELSATGPMWGPRMRRPQGSILDLECAAIEAMGLEEGLLLGGREVQEGTRRRLRVCLADVDSSEGSDDCGPYFECTFTLPPGAYATVVIDELLNASP